MTDPMAYLQAIAALAGVLVLVWLVSFALKRSGARGGRWSRSRRLSVTEVLPLDGKRRVVLLRCDGEEHMLLIGGDNDLVLATRPAPPEAAVKPAAPTRSGSAAAPAPVMEPVALDKREPTL